MDNENRPLGGSDGTPNDPRSPRVKEKFVVHIEEDFGEYLQEEPRYNGEVYFSNPPPRPAPPAQAAPVRRPQPAKKPVRKKRKLLDRNASIAYLAVCILIVLISGGVSIYAISCINDVLALNRDNYSVNITVPEKATTAEIIELLHNEGLIKRPEFCKLFFDLTYLFKTPLPTDKDGNVTGPRPDPVYNSGVYNVEADQGLEGMLNQFRYVRSSPKSVSLVFPEGFSAYQIAKRLEDANVCRAELFFSTLREAGYGENYSFIKDIPENANRNFTVEGYLFPARYEFFIDENPSSIVRRFLTTFQKNWTADYQKKADKAGLSIDQVIILASIVQREAASQEQMGGIAMVLLNRLKNPAEYPILGCNATKDYITRDAAKVFGTTATQELAAKYDTYAIEGLPPGSVCNPGKDAIEAVLSPDTGKQKWNFFQHDKNGEIYYAETDGQHKRKTDELRSSGLAP